MKQEAEQALSQFIEEWKDTPEQNKKAFLRLKSFLESKEGVVFDFVPRAGVTYSLRAAHSNQTNKSLYVMVDVIEDEPRWLSVCFYGDMITDPDERGDFVPEGLLGADAVCFDLEEWNEELLAYIEARLSEAHESAAKG